jgi:D-beta-D-heptose 7-phosphate kinase/D-beta-D-heptose 1-phosphate adenosyltransferase
METLTNSGKGKTVEAGKIGEYAAEHRKEGKKIVFTNGCFDVIHRGHIEYLRKAKEMGDILIIGLNTDASVRLNKGESRPVNSEEDRAEVLSSLEFVDCVVLFDDKKPVSLIKAVKPDILVKGGDYRAEDVAGRQYAGKTVILPYVPGYSTTRTLKKIKG